MTQMHSTPVRTGKLSRIRHWFRVVDDALHYDPTTALHSRIEILEKKLGDVEVTLGAD